MHCNHIENDCVCDVVRRIVVAQNKVAPDSECCNTSCEDSIEKLLSPNSTTSPQPTTIPIMLYCTSTCDPFVGKGIKKSYADCNNGYFFPVESYVFRAKDFVEGSYCCAVLEILSPYYGDHSSCSNKPKIYKHTKHPSDSPYDKWMKDNKKKSIKNFVATGVCLTVNLNKFIGVACLDPIIPMKM